MTKNGESVSASWGGFHAAASLADDGSAVASAGGNGLNAGAGYGAGGVAAGAGVHEAGSGSTFVSAGYPANQPTGGYGNGGKPGSAGGFFDRIFAVSILVWRVVMSADVILTWLNVTRTEQFGVIIFWLSGNQFIILFMKDHTFVFLNASLDFKKYEKTIDIKTICNFFFWSYVHVYNAY